MVSNPADAGAARAAMLPADTDTDTDTGDSHGFPFDNEQLAGSPGSGLPLSRINR
jgi:hypothetical protein